MNNICIRLRSLRWLFLLVLYNFLFHCLLLALLLVRNMIESLSLLLGSNMIFFPLWLSRVSLYYWLWGILFVTCLGAVFIVFNAWVSLSFFDLGAFIIFIKCTFWTIISLSSFSVPFLVPLFQGLKLHLHKMTWNFSQNSLSSIFICSSLRVIFISIMSLFNVFKLSCSFWKYTESWYTSCVHVLFY